MSEWAKRLSRDPSVFFSAADHLNIDCRKGMSCFAMLQTLRTGLNELPMILLGIF
jgi:hypothetical protein